MQKAVILSAYSKNTNMPRADRWNLQIQLDTDILKVSRPALFFDINNNDFIITSTIIKLKRNLSNIFIETSKSKYEIQLIEV